MNYSNYITSYFQFCIYQKNLSDKTIKAYRIDLNQFIIYLNTQPTNIINKENILSYIRTLYSKYKIKSIKRKIASIKAFTHFLYNEEYIDRNPFEKINLHIKEPKLLPKIIPINILQKIIEYPYHLLLTSHPTKYKQLCLQRNIAILETLFATGVRISELCNLNKSDIDFTNKIIKIMGKGSKERVIQIGNKNTLSALKTYYLNNKNQIENTQIFFINKFGNRMSEQSVRTMIRTYVAATHIDMHITPHMFRHTFATSLLEDNVDIRYIQHLLGHASITTTQIYTHVTSTKQKSIITKKNPMNRIHIRL